MPPHRVHTINFKGTPCGVLKVGDLVKDHVGRVGIIVELQEMDYVESWWIRFAGHKKRDIVEPRFLELIT